MNRRTFLQTSLAASLAASVPTFAALGRKPKILLRNAWQSQNIGDIAHYVGMLELLPRHGIDAEIYLWPSRLDNGAGELLAKFFPHVQIVDDGPKIRSAIEQCDYFLHGSCSGFGAIRNVVQWQETGKPFGVFGISITSFEPDQFKVLSEADFVFFRDSVSLKVAKEHGTTAPIMAFGPDTAFGVVKTRNDEAALQFLREHDLKEGEFFCCIPRYRWTPAWTVYPNREKDETKHQRNEEMKDHDHARLREAIVGIVRETNKKVLVTCEDQTQIALGKEMLVDPLPEDVKKNVVWRDRYWLPDEAVSTYTRSAGLFGNEMHSPIMCIANGIPAVVCRFEEQTNKGFMWRDIGLDDWLFNLDVPEDVAKIAPTILSLAHDPKAAREKAEAARQRVLKLQKETFGVLSHSLKTATERLG